MKNIKLQDIANKAGCSKNTASLILRGATKFSKELAEQVKEIAKNSGYIPNYAARNLASQKSDIIGIYTPTINDPVRAGIINDLIQNIHKANYKPFLGIGTPTNGINQSISWMNTFKHLNVALLVLVAQYEMEPKELTNDVPLLVLGCQPPENKIPHDYIAWDRSEVARIAMDHLIDRGYEYIINGCSANTITGQKFLTELKKSNLSHTHFELSITNQTNDLLKIIDKIQKIKTKRRKAIFFGDTLLAVKFMDMALNAKIKIPKDLAVISYDYFPWADSLKVPLTTICQPIEQMSEKAIDIIKYRLANKNSPFINKVIPHKLIVRKST
ncbi:MAG: hypothetical protein A2Y12_09215 [Planctomycetes bacterium GWF2_42_9]|nr:MAG: hypothetical protein A2Y12_09215 [Planctomycetes bacterium GWF2_42_9]